jgi:hypothetical protein
VHDGAALQFDHRLLDVGVDPSEHAGEQVAAEQQGLRGRRSAMVVAPVQRDHRVGHGHEQGVARQRTCGAGIAAFSLVLRVRCAREAKGENPRAIPSDRSAPPG